MNELKVNFDNLTAEERAELLKLVEKANKPKSKAWKPENGEEYYYFSESSIYDDTWDNFDFDIDNYSIGNCFKTKEEAQNALERLKIRAELQRYADEHNEPIDWKDNRQDKWKIYYNHSLGQIESTPFTSYQDAFQIYFTSEEIAKAAAQSVGEERIKKYLFGVE